MLVTDKQYSLDEKYINKLDLMIKRIEGVDDVVLPIDGDEGIGKTEFAVGTCYYISYKTGRHYGVDNIFFSLEEVISFIQNTKDQIIHFDEAVLGLLINQRWEKTQEQFLQLVMVARKKRHFIVLCIPKFHRLPSYVIEDRSIGLVHVYSRKNLEKGRFCYFKKKSKDDLYEYWKRKRVKAYKKFYDIHGTFGITSDVIFTPEEWEEYNRKKDEGIMSIGRKKEPRVDKYIQQRNTLIKFIKEHFKLPASKTHELLKSIGVELSTTQIKEAVKDKKFEKSDLGDARRDTLIYGVNEINLNKKKVQPKRLPPIN